MKLRILSGFLAVLLVFTLAPAVFSVTAAATEADSTDPAESTESTEVTEITEATEITEPAAPAREPNQCGEDMFWFFEEDTLTISGTGRMDDFEGDAPWAAHKDQIKALILEGKITYIGARAFKGYDKLELIDFGQHLEEIGEEAFWACRGLAAIVLPESFKVFGPSSFLGCSNLKEIHCAGRFPSFRLNCMWEVYATIYYPVERPWRVSNIAEMEVAFKGRIEFLASDGSDQYIPTEPTEEPTEESTEPTEETTEPTEATTEPTQPSEETTEPTQVTEAPTEAPTQAPSASESETEVETEAATEAPEDSSGGMGGLTGLAIVAGVMLLPIGGALVYRASSGRGKYGSRGKKR